MILYLLEFKAVSGDVSVSGWCLFNWQHVTHEVIYWISSLFLILWQDLKFVSSTKCSSLLTARSEPWEDYVTPVTQPHGNNAVTVLQVRKFVGLQAWERGPALSVLNSLWGYHQRYVSVTEYAHSCHVRQLSSGVELGKDQKRVLAILPITSCFLPLSKDEAW